MGHGLRQQWPALALALVGALAVATCVPQRRRSRAGGVAVGSLAEGTVRVVSCGRLTRAPRRVLGTRARHVC